VARSSGLPLVVVLVALVALDVAPLGGAPAPPNVVLVTLDTTRADRIGAWGFAGARTPHLDALAARGLRFARCDAAAPITLPSHATMLTGLYPPRHGVRDNGTFALAAAHETVAERFAAAGRDTAAVVAAVVLARRHGLDQGFRLYDDDLGAGYAAGTEVAERDAAAVTDAALAALATLRPPFFLWVHYYDAHEEYRPPSRFADLATGEHRLYDGELAYVDEQLGRLLAALPSDAAMVVAGDHGEMLGEQGETSHGLLLGAGARRVPLLAAGPGVPAGETISCLVRGADVAPTLLALGGLEIPPGLDGRNLLAADRGCGGVAYAESFLPFFAYRWYPLRALSDGRALFLQAPRPSLYDLERDPGEARDLAADEPQLAALWRGRLEKMLAAAGEPLEPRVEAGAALDAEQLRQLAALGYLGGGGGGAVSAELPDPRRRVEVARRLHEAAEGVQRGRCGEVLRDLQAIARDDPHNFPALTLAAQCLRDLGRPAEAIAVYRRAAAKQPSSPIPAANLGALLLDAGQYEEGERELRRALVLDPTNGASAARLARRLRESGRATEALAVMDAARAAGDRLPELLLERGATLAEAGRLDEALADFREAARRAPQSIEAAESVARALFALGRAREALVAYQSVARLAPGRADLWRTIGAMALDSDDRALAREAFAAALRLETDAAIRAELARVLAALDG
jgi:arylsulfatase A-like enzyme/Flp pilus assembly protein TadD